MSQYRILSIDGGGICGIISARLLKRLGKFVPDFTNRADLLAGTSTGAIIAAMLANDFSIDDISNLYRTKGKDIFSHSLARKLKLQIIASKYTNKGLYKILRDLFGNTKLGDLKKKVLIPALNLDVYDDYGQRSFKPKFFHNLEGQCEEELGVEVVDILMYTTAAPTFFPVYNGHVDGGLVANNPSMAALGQALDPKTLPQPNLSDICIFSVGTGKTSTYISNGGDWGYLQWLDDIVELMMDCGVSVTDYECRQLLKGNYIRMNPYLEADFRLDSVDSVDRMVELADNFDISSYILWLHKHFKD